MAASADDKADFVSGTGIEGWTVADGVYVSPTYSSRVCSVELAWSASGNGAADAKLAVGSGEYDLASFSAAAATGAVLRLSSSVDVHALRIAVPGGFSLASVETVLAGELLSGLKVSEDGYFQDFSAFASLPATSEWGDGKSLPGWTAYVNGTPPATIAAGYGNAGNRSAGLYAYRGTNRTEEAGLSIAAVSNTKTQTIFGFAMTNDADRALVDFGISFTARQWTFSKNRTAAQKFTAEYLVTDAFTSVAADGAWTGFFSMDSADGLEAAGANADYATGSAKCEFSATLEGVKLPAGSVFAVRWRSSGVASGEVYGVDDVSLACSLAPAPFTIRIVANQR